MSEQLSKLRMDSAAKAVYELTEILHEDAKQLIDSVERELFWGRNTTSPSVEGSAEIVIARCQIVRALYERMGKAVEALNQQAEILVTAPVLNNCT